MQNPERPIIYVFEDVMNYDLYFTDKRLIAVRTQFKKYIFSFWGGLIGAIVGVSSILYGGLRTEIGALLGVSVGFVGGLIGAELDKALELRNKRKYEQFTGLTLDDLVKGDKRSFAVSYGDIEKLRFYKSARSGFCLKFELISKDVRKAFWLTTEQSNQLVNVCLSIDALKGKIER